MKMDSSMNTPAKAINISIVTTLIFIASLSQVFAASISKQNLISLLRGQLTIELHDTAETCFNISADDIDNALDKSIQECSTGIPQQIDSDKIEFEFSAITDCIQNKIDTQFNLTPEQKYQCEDKLAKRDMDENLEVDHLLSDYSDFINAGLKAHASQSSIDEVSLPLFPNSHVVSHFSDNQMAIGDSPILPAIVLATDADFGDVRTFYQQKLPNYKAFAITNGIIFMKDAPEDFSILSHLSLYTNTPHVLIEDMQSNIHNNKEGKTKIEISYIKL